MGGANAFKWEVPDNEISLSMNNEVSLSMSKTIKLASLWRIESVTYEILEDFFVTVQIILQFQIFSECVSKDCSFYVRKV